MGKCTYARNIKVLQMCHSWQAGIPNFISKNYALAQQKVERWDL